jgi:hypothetical protein
MASEGCTTGRFAMGAEFPVFPVETGNFGDFPGYRPFGCENSDANQSLAVEFP